MIEIGHHRNSLVMMGVETTPFQNSFSTKPSKSPKFFLKVNMF